MVRRLTKMRMAFNLEICESCQSPTEIRVTGVGPQETYARSKGAAVIARWATMSVHVCFANL